MPGHEHWEHWWRFLTPSPEQEKLGLSCVAVGMQHGRLPIVGPRTQDFHVAVIVLSGSGWFSWGGRPPVDVVAPVLLWLLPGVEHCYGPYEPGWAECFVDFTGPTAEAYQRLGYVDEEHPVVPLSSAEPAHRIVRKMALAADEALPQFEVEVAAGVHELLVTLHRSRVDQDDGRRSLLAALARDAFLSLSIPEHARRLSLTPDELRDLVRHSAGCSPKEYLLGIRMNAAKDLLATTDLSVAAIARRVGYKDPAYFTRTFTRRSGMSPSFFREQQFRRVTTTSATPDLMDSSRGQDALLRPSPARM
nr:AraC family transcriptional regulator [Streptomyces alboflavus]